MADLKAHIAIFAAGLFLLALVPFTASLDIGGYATSCMETDGGLDEGAPGSIGGPTGVPFGPIVTIEGGSLRISEDYQTIEVKINENWYTADPYGYVVVPGELEAKILELNLEDRTARMIHNNFTDHCTGSQTLLEYSCDEPGYQKEITCDNGCVQGACANPKNPTSGKLLNINFGVWDSMPSPKVGASAVGSDGDFWNTVAQAWNNNRFKEGLKYSDNETGHINIRLINLGGGWGNGKMMGVKDAMLDSYNYPQYNQGGDSQVILTGVPEGLYSLYIYGHASATANGDYEVSVDGENLGRKITSPTQEAITSTNWVEGLQYVKFPNLNVKNGEIKIYIRPGGAPFYDTIINGLQLIPLSETDLESDIGAYKGSGAAQQSIVGNIFNGNQKAQDQDSGPQNGNPQNDQDNNGAGNDGGDSDSGIPAPPSLPREPIGDQDSSDNDSQKPVEMDAPIACKDSCSLNGKCYPFGYRKDGQYCSEDSAFVAQLGEELSCQNNFECSSNVCVSGKCISEDLMGKIIKWFTELFSF